MPVQNLYWIDDSAHDMYLIMEHVFPVLWNINCSCKTILFGNDYCSKETENGPSENDREAFETDLKGFFSVYCQEIDNQEWEEVGKTHEKKKHLLPNPSIFLIPLKDDRKTLTQHWLDRDLLKDVKDHPESLRGALAGAGHIGAETPDVAAVNPMAECVGRLSVEQLITDMNIPGDAAIALDICLLYHDIDRIEAGLPSISMALYDEFLKRHHRCYLYSNRSIARTVMDQWVQTFQNLFPKPSGRSDSIVIHPKGGLLAATPNTDAKRALVNLLQRKD